MDTNGLFVLTETGAIVWEKLTENKSADEIVAAICREYDADEETVRADVESLIAKLVEAGAKRCLPLKVSGPFHSSMLVGAGEKLAEELEEVIVHDIQIPYITNVTADYVTNVESVLQHMKKWRQFHSL